MKGNTFLTFSLHGMLLAVDANEAREIIWLPELTMIEECPPYIAGLVNMRGKLLPIVDLNIRFGHSPQEYSCSDRVIILGVSALRTTNSVLDNSAIKVFGIIVNDVLDVIDIQLEDIELPPFEGIETETHPHFVSGVAKVDQSIIMILNLATMLDPEFEIPEAESAASETAAKSSISYFCPGADPREREIFHNRAINLQNVPGGEDSCKVTAAAVVSLNNEYLCVELESVREFSKIHNITPVPCCSNHITGNMNLRGNVLTVVDIRGLLNMQSVTVSESAKVVVVENGEFSVGFIVDEILDVITLREMEIVPVPSSIKALDDKFVKGAVPYGSRMMALLDFKEILSWDGLTVNEEV